MPGGEPGCPALWRQGLRKTGISLVPKKAMVRPRCVQHCDSRPLFPPALYVPPNMTTFLTNQLTLPNPRPFPFPVTGSLHGVVAVSRGCACDDVLFSVEIRLCYSFIPECGGLNMTE